MASPTQLRRMAAAEARFQDGLGDVERLEAQIRALARESEDAERDMGRRSRPTVQQQPPSPTAYFRSADEGVFVGGSTGGERSQRQAPAAAAQQPRVGSPQGGAATSPGGRPRDDDGRGSVRSRSVRGGASPTAAAAAAAATASATGAGAAAAPGVVYRSSIYRSASPSRKVGRDLVVVSNLARAPRFRDVKTDVPGPGRYGVQYIMSDFAPPTVARFDPEYDAPGAPGNPATAPAGTVGGGSGSLKGAPHTWEEFHARRGTGLSNRAAHEAAMAAATARLRPDVPLAPGATMLSSGVSAAGGGSVVDADGGATIATTAAATMISAAGGSAVAALEAAIKRERALRREIEGLQRSAAAARVAAATTETQLREQVDAGRRSIRGSSSAHEALAAAVTGPVTASASGLAASYAGLQRAINELGTALAMEEAKKAAAAARRRAANPYADEAASVADDGGDEQPPAADAAVSPAALTRGLHAALARFPSLKGLVDAGRATDAALGGLTSAVSAAAAVVGGAGVPAAAATAAPAAAGAPPAGFLGYSSMAAASAAPPAIGRLGASGKLLPAKPHVPPYGGASGRASRSNSIASASVDGGEYDDVDGEANDDQRRQTVRDRSPRGRSEPPSRQQRQHHLTGSTVPFSGVKKITAAQIVDRARALYREREGQDGGDEEPGAYAQQGGGAADHGLTVGGLTGGGARSPTAAEGGGNGAAAAALAAIRSLGATQQQQQQQLHQHQQPQPQPPQLLATGLGAAFGLSSAAPPAQPRELSVADTLRRLFDCYAHPDVTGAGSRGLLSAGLLYALLRDAGVGEGDASSSGGEGGDAAAASGCEAAALAAAAFSSSSSSSSPDAPGPGLPFERFIPALNAVAQAVFRPEGPASLMTEADAFRLLLQRHVLPLYASLTAAGNPAAPTAATAAPAPAAAHGARLRALHGAVSGELAAWLGAHGAGLRGVFASYAQAQAPLVRRPVMPRRGLAAFAADFKLLAPAPPLLPHGGGRDELGRLADLVTARPGAAAPSPSAPLAFADWLDLLAVAAHQLTSSALDGAALPAAADALGVPPPVACFTSRAPWPPLDALCCLLNAMYSRGARWGADAAPALRAAVTAVRERIAAEDAASVQQQPAAASASVAGGEQRSHHHQQLPAAGGGYYDDGGEGQGGYDDDEDESLTAAETASVMDEEAQMYYEARAAAAAGADWSSSSQPATSAALGRGGRPAGLHVRSLVAAGGGGGGER